MNYFKVQSSLYFLRKATKNLGTRKSPSTKTHMFVKYGPAQYDQQEDPLEEEIATHSSILDWEIPWTEEPGGLQSMGLQRVRHD